MRKCSCRGPIAILPLMLAGWPSGYHLPHFIHQMKRAAANLRCVQGYRPGLAGYWCQHPPGKKRLPALMAPAFTMPADEAKPEVPPHQRSQFGPVIGPRAAVATQPCGLIRSKIAGTSTGTLTRPRLAESAVGMLDGCTSSNLCRPGHPGTRKAGRGFG